MPENNTVNSREQRSSSIKILSTILAVVLLLLLVVVVLVALVTLVLAALLLDHRVLGSLVTARGYGRAQGKCWGEGEGEARVHWAQDKG